MGADFEPALFAPIHQRIFRPPPIHQTRDDWRLSVAR
jgi:hypothetical protein